MQLGGRHNMPPPRNLDFWPFDLEVGAGVACDLGYPCAKFRLPRPFGFRVRADVRDIRQTDGRRTPMTAWCPRPPLRGGGIIRHTIPPEVIIFEAVVAQVMPLLFDMGEIKKVSLKPGFEDCYWRAFKKRVPDGRSWVTETTSGEVSFGERLTQQRSVGRS